MSDYISAPLGCRSRDLKTVVVPPALTLPLQYVLCENANVNALKTCETIYSDYPFRVCSSLNLDRDVNDKTNTLIRL